MPAPPRRRDVTGAIVVQVTALAERRQVGFAAVHGPMIEMRHGQHHAVPGDRMGLVVPGVTPLATPSLALPNPERNRFPIDRVTGAIERHG